MKFRIGDIVQADSWKTGIIVDMANDRAGNEYALATGKPDLITWWEEDKLTKLSGGIKGNKTLGTFVHRMLHRKGHE